MTATTSTPSVAFIDPTPSAYDKTGCGTMDNPKHISLYSKNDEIYVVQSHFDEYSSLLDSIKNLARELYHKKNLATEQKECYNEDDNTAVLDSNEERTVTE